MNPHRLSRKTEVDQSVYTELGLSAHTNPYDDQECVERGVFAMVNECCLALDADRIVETPHEVDLAMIMGTGFPPFRGGLLKYADSVGTKYIAERLTHYAQSRNAKARLSPSVKLAERAQTNKKFYV